MGKETIIHIDHQPLQYQTKLQQSRHFRWMGFLQQFHLVIRQKKDIYNRVTDMFSRQVVNVAVLLKNHFVLPESYVEQYTQDADFQQVYSNLSQGHQVEELDYHVHDNLLYHLGKICVPQGKRVNITRETHTSLIVRHFGVSKTVANLQRSFYWPHILKLCHVLSEVVYCL